MLIPTFCAEIFKESNKLKPTKKLHLLNIISNFFRKGTIFSNQEFCGLVKDGSEFLFG
jgi:hypothetical protein